MKLKFWLAALTISPSGGTTIELADAALKGLLSPALSSKAGEGDRTANSFDKSPNSMAVPSRAGTERRRVGPRARHGGAPLSRRCVWGAAWSFGAMIGERSVATEAVWFIFPLCYLLSCCF